MQLKGKQPKLAARQQTRDHSHACHRRMHHRRPHGGVFRRPPGCLGGVLYALVPVPGIVVDLPG